MTWETVIVGVIAALPGLLGLYQARRKLNAETAAEWIKVARETAKELDEEKTRRRDLARQVIKIDEQLRRMEIVLEHYRDGTNRLIGQLISLGHKPVWEPNEAELIRKFEEKES